MKPVDIATGLKVVISNLESSAIDYMIVGSVAATVYGEPRLTNDLDLVVSMSGSSANALLSAFESNEFYLPPIEIISQEVTRSGQTNLLHEGQRPSASENELRRPECLSKASIFYTRRSP